MVVYLTRKSARTPAPMARLELSRDNRDNVFEISPEKKVKKVLL